jgi:hypothetical protein
MCMFMPRADLTGRQAVVEAFVPAELETRGAILQMRAAKHSCSNGRLELGMVLPKWYSKA